MLGSIRARFMDTNGIEMHQLDSHSVRVKIPTVKAPVCVSRFSLGHETLIFLAALRPWQMQKILSLQSSCRRRVSQADQATASNLARTMIELTANKFLQSAWEATRNLCAATCQHILVKLPQRSVGGAEWARHAPALAGHTCVRNHQTR